MIRYMNGSFHHTNTFSNFVLILKLRIYGILKSTWCLFICILALLYTCIINLSLSSWNRFMDLPRLCGFGSSHEHMNLKSKYLLFLSKHNFIGLHCDVWMCQGFTVIWCILLYYYIIYILLYCILFSHYRDIIYFVCVSSSLSRVLFELLDHRKNRKKMRYTVFPHYHGNGGYSCYGFMWSSCMTRLVINTRQHDWAISASSVLTYMCHLMYISIQIPVKDPEQFILHSDQHLHLYPHHPSQCPLMGFLVKKERKKDKRNCLKINAHLH